MTPPSGADGVVDEDGSLRGHIFFHLGDDSPRRAYRAKRRDLALAFLRILAPAAPAPV